MITTKEREGRALLDHVPQPIYDRKEIAVTASQTHSYFKDFAVGSTLLVTNMTTPAQLGTPQEFRIFGLSSHVSQGTTLADVQQLYNSAYIELKINGRPKVQVPLWMLPDLGGLNGAVSTTVNNTTFSNFSNGMAIQNGWFPLDILGRPVKLNSQEEFYCDIVVAAPGVFSATFYLWLVLHGIFGKAR